jgi:acetyl-CoA acetyltransferase
LAGFFEHVRVWILWNVPRVALAGPWRAELVYYDNLMLCGEGNAVDRFRSGATWRMGSTPVNVSGELESKGHPSAAIGTANVWRVCHALRGEAGPRQLEGAKAGLAHLIGLASACGIHILESSSA